ncbi:MAG TPA: TetR family transcriptional regulator C-terminal domain-containing protein [Thermoanaerobaculia bacterium]|nr:TetR family transcriptional regulator C-terminal domain-containing protein [Thermoanaerobaculia bacterium]
MRDAVAKQMDDWFGALERAIRMAKDEGHLDPDVDPAQLAFELNALFFGANFAYNLRHDEEAFARARRAIEQRLESIRSYAVPVVAARPAAREFID